MCQKNRDYRFERTASGELLIMPPTDSDTGNRNFDMVVYWRHICQEQHLPTLAGNEVLKEFQLKLTPMNNAVP